MSKRVTASQRNSFKQNRITRKGKMSSKCSKHLQTEEGISLNAREFFYK